MIDVKNAVTTDDGQILALRLRDQHPVKWVAVLAGEGTSPGCMGQGNRQVIKAKAHEITLQIANQYLAGWKAFPDALWSQFPQAEAALTRISLLPSLIVWRARLLTGGLR